MTMYTLYIGIVNVLIINSLLYLNGKYYTHLKSLYAHYGLCYGQICNGGHSSRTLLPIILIYELQGIILIMNLPQGLII